MSIAAFPYIIVLGLFFGSTLIASRFAVGQFEPTNYVAIRLALATLAHMTIYLFSKRKWPLDRRIWKHAAILGLLGTAIPMSSIVTSLRYQSSGLTAILLTVGPAITVVMAHFFLPDEKLNGRKIVGVVISLGGAVLMALLGESGLPDVPSSANGYLLVLIAMFMGSAAAVYIRRNLQGIDPFDVASVRMLFAAIGVSVFVFLFVGFDLSQVNATGYTALGYATLFGTFLGLLLALYIAQRFGATAAAMTSYVIPVFAAIGGLLFLDEAITPGMIGGVLLIVLGIAIINRKPRRANLRPYH